MTNEIFIARKIDELPKEEGWYLGQKESLDWGYFFYDKNEGWVKPIFLYWIEPITLEQLIAENPQVVEKIFEAAREPKIGPLHVMKYPTATDYINSLKG